MKCNYCINSEKFRWLLLHVQMIAGVGLLVVIYPFQETKLVGYLLYSAYSTVASIQLYSSAEHQQ